MSIRDVKASRTVLYFIKQITSLETILSHKFVISQSDWLTAILPVKPIARFSIESAQISMREAPHLAQLAIYLSKEPGLGILLLPMPIFSESQGSFPIRPYSTLHPTLSYLFDAQFYRHRLYNRH